MDNITIKRLVNTLDFDAVCLPPEKQIPLHSQCTWELSCVITGEGTRLLGDISENFFPGDTVLIPPAFRIVGISIVKRQTLAGILKMSLSFSRPTY